MSQAGTPLFPHGKTGLTIGAQDSILFEPAKLRKNYDMNKFSTYNFDIYINIVGFSTFLVNY